MRVGGTLDLAQFEHLTADPVTELYKGRVYYNTTSNDVRYYDGSSWQVAGTSGSLATHIADTTTHGTTGDIVGTSDTQTLTNKTIDADNSTISNLAHGAEVDNPSSGVHGVTGTLVGTTDAQTLTNKTIAAASNTISGLAHGTEVDNASSGVHGATGTIVGTTDAQTLTNKTIAAASNTISGLAHGTEVDNAASGVHGVTGSVVGTTDTQTLTNKTIDADNSTISNLAHGAEVDNPSSGVHGVTGSVVGTTDTQTLTNKTIDADNSTISNLAHGAEVDDPSSGVHGVTGSVVGTSDTQSLSNKTFTDDTPFTSTGAITVPVGATGSRPGAPTNGMFRFNSSTGNFEGYDGSWGSIGGAGGGGGGGTVTWSPVSGSSPILVEENGESVYQYEAGLTQTLQVFLKVPSSYVAATQINMIINHYSPSAANTVLLKATATLIRTGTDAVSTTTNQRTTTNAAITNTLADKLTEATLDLTDGSGAINAVAVSAGDIIRVELERGTDTDTADVRFIPSATEATFS
jgi:hypothetical protein